MKIRLEVELDYDEDTMHDKDGDKWFKENVLGGTGDEGLLLHSNYLGDEIGTITVLRVIEVSG